MDNGGNQMKLSWKGIRQVVPYGTIFQEPDIPIFFGFIPMESAHGIITIDTVQGNE